MLVTPLDRGPALLQATPEEDSDEGSWALLVDEGRQVVSPPPVSPAPVSLAPVSPPSSPGSAALGVEVPRRSSRSTAGYHSNPHRLPQSAGIGRAVTSGDVLR